VFRPAISAGKEKGESGLRSSHIRHKGRTVQRGIVRPRGGICSILVSRKKRPRTLNRIGKPIIRYAIGCGHGEDEDDPIPRQRKREGAPRTSWDLIRHPSKAEGDITEEGQRTPI